MPCRDILCSAVASVLFMGLASCSSPAVKSDPIRYRESQPLFGTIAQVDICLAREQEQQVKAVYQQVWQRLQFLQQRLNLYDEQSELALLNRSYPQAYKVGPDLYQLIQDSVGYHRLSEGAFDVTIPALSQMWKTAEKNNQLPTFEQVRRAQQNLGIAKIRLIPPDQVQLLDVQTRLDLGGIVAGYAADVTAQILREAGFKDFYIDMGGEVFVQGKNCQGQAWHIGIRSPEDAGRITEVLLLSNAAVSTSGSYERFYEIQGQRWSKILNPLTGYPSQGVISATVIAPDTETADVLSTALCVLGPRQGIALIDSLGPGYAALLIIQTSETQEQRHPSQRFSGFVSPR